MDAGILTDKEAEKLFAPLKVDDLSSAGDVAKEFNTRLEGIQKWVTQQIEEKAKAVKKDVQASSQEAESKKIANFAKSHPELKAGSEVAAMMEQLYITNQDLEDIYKKSCMACGLKPVALDKDGKTIDLSTGKPADAKDTKDKGKAKEDSEFISSLKSDDLSADADDVDDGELTKSKNIDKMSVRDIADANWNKALSDAGISDVPE